MAEYASGVEETITTEGVADVIFGGATTEHRSFASVSQFVDGKYVPYCIRTAGGDIEAGMGQLQNMATAPGMTREFVFESTDNNNKLTLPAGTHKITCALLPRHIIPAGFTLYEPNATVLAPNQTHFLAWNQRFYDPDDLFPNITVSPVDTILFPAWVDWVRVHAQIEFAELNTTGFRSIQIYPIEDNANRYGYPRNKLPTITTDDDHSCAVTSNRLEVRGTTNRGIRVGVRHDATESLNIAFNYNTWVNVEFIG